MDKQELDLKITEVAKAILSYCVVRTSTKADAEDLAQDILLEIYKSADSLRNEDAFYGFMWAVAGNVYKNWCKKKAKDHECELTENIVNSEQNEDDFSEVYLLRRELTLLSEKYRKAVILYYIQNRSCADISTHLNISESMVKYLLFKSRQILKEGMTMERNYGEQSYNPRSLTILFWGNGNNRYWGIGDNKISQNILFACYHEKLTDKQISLQIGVALPYMEEKLNELVEYDLVKKDGNRYSTNIVIFTEDMIKEIRVKTAAMRKAIANIVMETVTSAECEIRALDFYGSDMPDSSFKWQMVCFLIYQTIIERYCERHPLTLPVDKFGTECFVWAKEQFADNSQEDKFLFGIANGMNPDGVRMQFMDFPINGRMMHWDFCSNKLWSNVFLDIASGNTKNFNENDLEIVAEMVRKGYVLSNDEHFSVNVPVFSRDVYRQLKTIFKPATECLIKHVEALTGEVAKIIRNHVPPHLKNQANSMEYLRLFDDAISAPVAELYERQFLIPYTGSGMLPTTYVIFG